VKYYIDTSVWRDYFEDRKNGIRPLGEFAFRFLNQCSEKGFKILYSHFVVEELLRSYSKEKVKLIFESYREHLVEVKETDEMNREALKLASKFRIPLLDAFHALLARANNAIVVSRDRHFERISHIAEVRLPEELI